MIPYSRLGVYKKHLKAKAEETEKVQATDWVNIGLFLLLLVVLILFIFT